jgi:23S rRNA (guanine745-N1)-methyltransferase
VAGVDVARPAIAAAAARHREGWYAVASVFEMPVPPASIDVLVSVFGPVASEEFARVLRPSGAVVAVHPGPRHLFALRELVYERPAPHEVKDPLRDAQEMFSRSGTATVGYPLAVPTADAARQLLAMTPYRWHAPRDIDDRLAAAGGLDTEVDVVISTYERR